MWFKHFISVFKQVRQEYKQQQYMEKQKRKLLSANSDWYLLEQLIQAVNTNSDLRVEVRLQDGTTLLLKTYRPAEKKSVSQLIDGDVGDYENGSYVVK